VDGGQEIAGEFVVTGSNASKLFQAAEASFDDIATFVGALVGAVERCSVGLVRNDGHCAATDNLDAKGIAVVSLVAEDGAAGGARAIPAGAAAMSASWRGVR
jgi:hypothetical protein